MSKTIKTINLLNKRANGEKLPQKIKYLDEYYTLYEEAESIENLYLLDGVRVGWFNHANFRLNTAVEIIEEQEEINIQNIEELENNYTYYEDLDGGTIAVEKVLNKAEKDLFNKINELVQAVKQLDRNIKEKQ